VRLGVTLDLTMIRALIVLLLLTSAANAQTAIGRTTKVKPEAHGTVAGTLQSGGSVHANETIGTGSAGQADMRFHDNSNLVVGPSSSVKLDKFIYNPNAGAGQMILNATKGSFRFSTGAQSKGDIKVKTPYGTLGVRG
jgi:hypothetical protein